MVSAAELTGAGDRPRRASVDRSFGDACATQILEKRRVDLEAGVAFEIAQESVTAEQFAPLRSSGAAGQRAGGSLMRKWLESEGKY